MNLINQFLFKLNYHPLWNRKLNVWENCFIAPSADRLLALLLYKANIMGHDLRPFFKEHIKDGMSVIDIGANQGIFSILFSSLVNEYGAVHCFEPDPFLFKHLRTNIALNFRKNIFPYNMAIGASNRRLSLCRGILNSGDNRINRAGEHPARLNLIAQVVSLDSFFEEEIFHFIKMDIQGWEYEALKGMIKLLRRSPDIKILFEFWPYGLRLAGSNPIDIFSFLNSEGFNYSYKKNNKWLPINDLDAFINSFKRHHYTDIFASKR